MKQEFDFPILLDADTRRLKGIFIEDYQSIKNPVYIKFDGLTLLYGPNSAGKSAVIDALELWRYFVGINESKYNNNAIWSNSARLGSRLGLAFTANALDDEEDAEVSRWLNDSIYLQQPHINFMNLIDGRLVQIEYNPGNEGLKVAIDGMPLFELNGLTSFKYNDDGSPTLGEEEEFAAEESSRECWGEWIFNKSHPVFLEAFDWVRRLAKNIEDDVGPELYIDREPVFSRYSYSAASKQLITIGDDRIVIRGIGLDWFTGVHSRINIKIGLGLSTYLLKADDGTQLDRKIRRELHSQIQTLSEELNLIVAGLSLQLRQVLTYTHVLADRKTLNSSTPAFVSDDLSFLNLRQQDGIHESVKEYAEYLSSPGCFTTQRSGPGKDFVRYCFNELLPSLRGYEIEADVLEVSNTTQDRARRYQNVNDGRIVHLIVKTPQGDYRGLNEVGSGISYVLPILTAVWASSFTVVEQPELHLHPAAQCELADVFLAAVAHGRRCLVESHSEHLLLRVLRRIRETELKKTDTEELMLRPEDLNIYYFEPDGEGSTEVKRIRVDHLGEFLNDWPNGFFPEREKELFDE